MMKVDPVCGRELSGAANNLQPTSIYINLEYSNLHQSASICTMLQCKSFMLQVAFLEHLEPSPPGRQHLETNTAQQNRSTCIERSHGRRAFHNW